MESLDTSSGEAKVMLLPAINGSLLSPLSYPFILCEDGIFMYIQCVTVVCLS